MIKNVIIPLGDADDLFPCGDEGENVQTSPAAIQRARAELGVDDTAELKWHLPDVFSVRYGSSYMASASHGENKVRFLSDEGDFREGDDRE